MHRDLWRRHFWWRLDYRRRDERLLGWFRRIGFFLLQEGGLVCQSQILNFESADLVSQGYIFDFQSFDFLGSLPLNSQELGIQLIKLPPVGLTSEIGVFLRRSIGRVD